MSDEFCIAADITLYTNPLDRALIQITKETKKEKDEKESNEQKPEPESTPELEPSKDEIVAADLKPYTSPMREFETTEEWEEPWKDIAPPPPPPEN